jgi:hypothetical protein
MYLAAGGQHTIVTVHYRYYIIVDEMFVGEMAVDKTN